VAERPPRRDRCSVAGVMAREGVREREGGCEWERYCDCELVGVRARDGGWEDDVCV
jgi:hypothetical protein